MDAAAFEQVYGAFGDFHAYFAPAVWPPGDAGAQRSLSPGPAGNESGERRMLRTCRRRFRVSARGRQRFLTDSPWDDEAIIGRLQEYPGNPAGASGRGVGAGRQRLSPSQGRSRREWPGSTAEAGKVANARRNVPGLCQPVGDGPWWTNGCICRRVGPRQRRCEAAGVPEDSRATGRRRSGPWRCWGGHRRGAT